MTEVIVQKRDHDCFVASLAMAKKCSYKEAHKLVKKHSKVYSIPKRLGINSNEVEIMLKGLGFLSYEVPVGSYKLVSTAMKGHRGILLFTNIYQKGQGHACYWDGYKVVDPVDGKKYWFLDYIKAKPYVCINLFPFSTGLVARAKNVVMDVVYSKRKKYV